MQIQMSSKNHAKIMKTLKIMVLITSSLYLFIDISSNITTSSNHTERTSIICTYILWETSFI